MNIFGKKKTIMNTFDSKIKTEYEYIRFENINQIRILFVFQMTEYEY